MQSETRNRRMNGALFVIAMAAFLPLGKAHAQSANRSVTVSMGRPGDHWASMLQYTHIGAARRNDKPGYEVSFRAADGCETTIFWHRDQIDFRGDTPGYRLFKVRVKTGWLYYPSRLTAASLPEVHGWVLHLNAYYTAQANGAIAAAQAFGVVATMGTLAPVPGAVSPAPAATRTLPTATRTLPTATRTAPTTARTVPTATRTAPATTRAAPTATRTLPTATRTAPAAARTAPTASRAASTAAPAAAPARSNVWTMQPLARGRAIEQSLGTNLPSNFPVIDRFARGTATSIKSLDLTAKSYQSTARLTRTVTRYIDSVARFRGRTWGGATVRGADITGRVLELVVPAGSGTAAQRAALQASVRYGQSVGVTVRVIPL